MRSNLYGNRQARSSAAADSVDAKAARHNAAEMEEQLQRENEALLNALGNSVSSMKSMAGNLHRDAGEQNTMLKELREAFTSARSGVGSATAGLQNVMSRYGWRHTALFGLALFLMLYFLYWAATRK